MLGWCDSGGVRREFTFRTREYWWTHAPDKINVGPRHIGHMMAQGLRLLHQRSSRHSSGNPTPGRLPDVPPSVFFDLSAAHSPKFFELLDFTGVFSRNATFASLSHSLSGTRRSPWFSFLDSARRLTPAFSPGPDSFSLKVTGSVSPSSFHLLYPSSLIAPTRKNHADPNVCVSRPMETCDPVSYPPPPSTAESRCGRKESGFGVNLLRMASLSDAWPAPTSHASQR